MLRRGSHGVAILCEGCWSCGAALIALVALGCTESHAAGDAAHGLDAGTGVRVDARVDDAAAAIDARTDCGVARPCGCVDEDGDGHGAPECGGDDCDDTRADLSPARGACMTAVERAACDDGMVTREPCPLDAPHCDARTGACAATACGDGVLHGGEECDDGNGLEGDGCSPDCRYEPCLRNADCPAHLPSCSDRREDGHTYCRSELLDGSPMGTRCLADSECASGWCHEEMRRCTVRCLDTGDCEGMAHWCTSGTRWDDEEELFCAFGCFRPPDCDEGTACTRTYHRDGYLVTRCRYQMGSWGLGEGCALPNHCETNTCWLREGCTHFCLSDEDCEDADLSSCVELYVDLPDRPEHWVHLREYMCSRPR